MSTPAERQQRIDAVRRFPAELEALVSPLSDAQLYTVTIPGEWTVAQNVHHLADAHINAFIRVKLLLTEDQPMVKPFDQDRWAETEDARQRPLAESLSILRGLHARWAALFESLSEADWAQAGHHPETGVITVDGLLRTYARHGRAHIEQIQKALAAGGW